MSIIQARTNHTSIVDFDNIIDLYNYIEFNEITWLKIENVTFNNYFYFPIKLQQLFINNCTNCNLYLCYLPNDITFVEIINCMLNEFDFLFISTNNYNNLETINISYNRLIKIPNNLPDKLISLNLSNNDINNLPNINCFSKEIQYINLSCNKLNDLPEWILELDANLMLMPNYFWFNSYSNISLNKDIKEYHIMIAHKFFDSSLANKLIRTRNTINNVNVRINRDVDTLYMNALIERGIDPVNFVRMENGTNNTRNNTINNVKTTSEQGENIHNSDIQDSFSKSVFTIMKYNAPKNSNYLNSVYYYYLTDGFDIFTNLRVCYIISTNCKLPTIVSRCGVTYMEIFEKIWSITETHKDRIEMRQILKEEILAGANLCFTGQVTRIVNSLCGFIDGIQISYSENEQINNVVIAIMRRCENDTTLNAIEEVKKSLDELHVSEDKQKIWLESLY
jgi:hypothetical protein